MAKYWAGTGRYEVILYLRYTQIVHTRTKTVSESGFCILTEDIRRLIAQHYVCSVRTFTF